MSPHDVADRGWVPLPGFVVNRPAGGIVRGWLPRDSKRMFSLSTLMAFAIARLSASYASKALRQIREKGMFYSEHS